MVTGDVVYTCPMMKCGWSYTEPQAPPVLFWTGEKIPDDLSAAIGRSAAEHRATVDAALKEHLDSHPVDEWLELVQMLRQALGNVEPGHPLLVTTAPASVPMIGRGRMRL